MSVVQFTCHCLFCLARTSQTATIHQSVALAGHLNVTTPAWVVWVWIVVRYSLTDSDWQMRHLVKHVWWTVDRRVDVEMLHLMCLLCHTFQWTVDRIVYLLLLFYHVLSCSITLRCSLGTCVVAPVEQGTIMFTSTGVVKMKVSHAHSSNVFITRPCNNNLASK